MTDPRYDPRFQRGWDGTPPPTGERAPVERAPTPPSVAEPAPAPVAPRVAAPPVAPAPETDAAPDEVAVPETDEQLPQGRNPYRIALAVLGLVLTLGGGVMLWQLAQPTTGSGPADDVIPQLEAAVAPWIALAGLLAIIAVVALGAFRRR